MSDGTIAGVHGLRVWATWLSAEDLFPTYAALLVKHSAGGPGTPNYSGVVTDYGTYEIMLRSLDESTTEEREDITCDDLGNAVVGVRIDRGRNSIGEAFESGTLAMTLKDVTGKHDPRRPPAGASRTGTKIEVEVDPELKDDWTTIYTGFVESWERRVEAGNDTFSEIEVDCSDGFSLLARARAIPPTLPVGSGQNGSQRVNLLLDEAKWVPKWGDRNITGGLLPMNPTMFSGGEGDALLDEITDVTTSEDGIFYMEADGTFFWYDRYWRGLRREKAAVVDITGEGTTEQYPGMKPLCPSAYRASDDDLDMVNRAIVWRSTDFDPEVGGSQPPVIKKVNAETYPVLVSISEHGLITKEYGDLPHAIGTDDTVSQSLADRIVGRLAGPTNLVGDFEIPLVKEFADAEVVVGLQFGDQILSWDDTVDGTPREYPFEFVGIEHDITPDHWDVTLRVDRWVDTEFLLPLGVVPGKPGYFTPPGATVPADLTTLRSLGPLGETTAWAKGEFVWLDDGTRAYWDGDSWEVGALGDPTSVTAGVPGQFFPLGSEVPLNFDVLVSLGPLGSTTRWAPGQWVDLQDGSDAWWNGTSWQVGVTPVDALAGKPGSYDPVSSTFANAAAMNTAKVRAVPDTPWLRDQWVPTGDLLGAHWNGFAWATGLSPGYGISDAVWDLARWEGSVWVEAPPPTGPTVIFSDPCDVLTQWTTTSSASIVTGGHTGNGLRLNGTGNARWTVSVEHRGPRLDASFWWQTSSAAQAHDICVWKSGGNNQIKLMSTATGQLVLQAAGVTVGTTAAGTVASNTWYLIEVVNVVIADGTGGSVTLKVNGTALLTLTGIDTSFGTSTPKVTDEWSIQTTGTGQNQTFDDITLTLPSP